MNIFETIYRQLLTEAEFVASKVNPANKEIFGAGRKIAKKRLEKTQAMAKAKAEVNKSGLNPGEYVKNGWIYNHKGERIAKNTTALDRPVRVGDPAKHRDEDFVIMGVNALKQFYNISKGKVKNLHEQKWVRNNPETEKYAREGLINNILRDWKNVRGVVQVGGGSKVLITIINQINNELKLKKPFKIFVGENAPQTFALQHSDFKTQEDPHGVKLGQTMGGHQVNGWHMAGYCAVGYAVKDFCVEKNIDLKDKNNPVSQYYNGILQSMRQKMNRGEVPYSKEDLYDFIQTETSKISDLALPIDPKEKAVVASSALKQNQAQTDLPFPPQEGNLTTGLAVKKD